MTMLLVDMGKVIITVERLEVTSEGELFKARGEISTGEAGGHLCAWGARPTTEVEQEQGVPEHGYAVFVVRFAMGSRPVLERTGWADSNSGVLNEAAALYEDLDPKLD